jgi:transcriptional regulator with XRE-family HTH domain
MNGGPIEDAEWSRAADAREAALPKLGPYPVAGLLRRARRMAGVSQRELARRVAVSPSTVGRIESGAIVPLLPVFARMMAVAGLWLVVVDHEGHIVAPMRDIDDIRNGGGCLYPSHLDTILDPRRGEWWGDQYGLARPPETFHRDRERRDRQRERSVYSVREIWSYGLGDMSAMPPDDLEDDGPTPRGEPATDDPALPDDRPRAAWGAPARPGDSAEPARSAGSADPPRSEGRPDDAAPSTTDDLRLPRQFPIGFRRRKRR